MANKLNGIRWQWFGNLPVANAFDLINWIKGQGALPVGNYIVDISQQGTIITVLKSTGEQFAFEIGGSGGAVKFIDIGGEPRDNKALAGEFDKYQYLLTKDSEINVRKVNFENDKGEQLFVTYNVLLMINNSIDSLNHRTESIEDDISIISDEIARMQTTIENLTSQVASLQQQLANKQNKLTAGENIRIENDVISASGEISTDFASITGDIYDNESAATALNAKANIETLALYAKLDADNVFTGYNKFLKAPKIVCGDNGQLWICKNDNDSKTPSIAIQPQKNVNEFTKFYINAYAHPYPDYELTLPNKSGMIATLDDIEQLIKKELRKA